MRVEIVGEGTFYKWNQNRVGIIIIIIDLNKSKFLTAFNNNKKLILVDFIKQNKILYIWLSLRMELRNENMTHVGRLEPDFCWKDKRV